MLAGGSWGGGYGVSRPDLAPATHLPPHMFPGGASEVPAVGPLLPSFLFGFQRDVWPFLQLNWELVGLVGGLALALWVSRSGGRDLVGASACVTGRLPS